MTQHAHLEATKSPMSKPQSQTSETATRAKLVIADKNPVMRSGLSELLTRDGRFEVVGCVSNGNELITFVDDTPPDIAVMGWSFADMKGGDVLSALKRRHATTRLIVYTGEPGKDVLRQAIRLGAWGFISKSDDTDLLVETVASVARGRMSLPYIDMQSLTSDPLGELTARERELLVALANGWTNLQIASRTGISRNTVKYHLKNLYDKLGVSNRAMAVALYMSTAMDQR